MNQIIMALYILAVIGVMYCVVELRKENNTRSK